MIINYSSRIFVYTGKYKDTDLDLQNFEVQTQNSKSKRTIL